MQAARLQKIETESTEPLQLQASKDEVSRLRAATLPQEIDQGPAKMEATATDGPNEAASPSKEPNVAHLVSQIKKLEEVCFCLQAQTLVRMSLPCKHIYTCMYVYVYSHACMYACIGSYKYTRIKICDCV